MEETEQPILEQVITQNFDLVLYGHEHLPRFSSVSGNFGEIKFIPAGSAYAGRWPGNPRYTNAYNFGLVDLTNYEGMIHHRPWFEERDSWQRDDRYWPDGEAKFLLKRELFAANRDLFAANKKYIFESQRQLKRFYSMRPAKKLELTFKQEGCDIGGASFVETTIRYKADMYPGPKETFKLGILVGKRILNHPSKEVRSRAFKIISTKPAAGSTYNDKEDPSKIIVPIEMSEGQLALEYHYQMLLPEQEVWLLDLRRFVDSVKVIIEKAKGYNYEFCPLGGFPPLHPGPDGILSFDSLQSDTGHLPHQGYLIQWYR
jgi:hypothetical protein